MYVCLMGKCGEKEKERERAREGKVETERRDKETTIYRQKCDSLQEEEMINYVISEFIDQVNIPCCVVSGGKRKGKYRGIERNDR